MRDYQDYAPNFGITENVIVNVNVNVNDCGVIDAVISSRAGVVVVARLVAVA